MNRFFRQTSRRRAVKALAAVALAVSAAMPLTAAAQDSTKSIRIIVPFPAGGITDVMVRLVGSSVGKTLNRNVVVENRPGAAGTIGTKAALQPGSDGATTLVTTYIGFYGLPFTQKGATYDPVKDFVPVAMMADGPAVVFVHSSVPAKTMQEFLAWAKTQKQGIESATSGPGGGSHTWTLLLAKRAGIELLPVPYKGGAEMTTAMITGEAKLMISTTSEALNSQVKAGKVRILAVASDRPSALLPGVPLASDAVPGFVVEGWYGLHAPAGTSPQEIAAISAAVKKAVDDPMVRERLAGMYLEPRYANPADFQAAGVKTQEFWRRLVADLNIQPQ
jgi:tripartite-type tricarboxylate transporter receptor subunit TctC